ncbi:hypothetical protein ACMD2_25656, partial [Ananas comosus]
DLPMKKRVIHPKFTTNMTSESSKQQGQQNHGLHSQETSKHSSNIICKYQRSNFQTAADQHPPLSRNENVDEADYGLLSHRMQYSTRSGTVRSRMKAGPLPNIVEHSANRGGKELSRAEIFVLTHTKKNKGPMNKASSDHIKITKITLAQKISFPKYLEKKNMGPIPSELFGPKHTHQTCLRMTREARIEADKKVDMLNEKIHNMEEKYRKMMKIFGSEENYEKVMAMFTSMQQTKTSEPLHNDAPIAQSDHLKDRQNYENECSFKENSQQEIESSLPVISFHHVRSNIFVRDQC